MMLHMAPRLRAVQEQRDARRVIGPDLTRITSFATLLVNPTPDSAGRVHIHLCQVRPGETLPPFYLERLLARLPDRHPVDQAAGDPAGPWPRSSVTDAPLTDAEGRAVALWEAASSVLQAIDDWRFEIGGIRSSNPRPPLSDPRAAQQHRIPRSDLFRAGLVHGERIARLVEVHTIDPVRQDHLVPGDPFVQTTLYVVAPLYEPSTSALIWPTVTHLMSYLGRRHIAQVVGIFATGSYAIDSSRALEDAGAYASLAELEVLAGLRRDGSGRAGLVALIEGATADDDRGAWLGYQVGEPLFDRIYLVDREKSNQALAQDSYELTVLVGNALEALIVADGGQYIQEQLGIDLRDSQERPYSLVGAATDYVPLDYIFQTVNQQEEKRLVREQVLGAGEQGNEGSGDAEGRQMEVHSLADLGGAPGQVLAQLILRLPDLFVNVTPRDISELQARREFVLPPLVAAELRDLAPLQWEQAFEAHLHEAMERFNVAVGVDALDEAWGLQALDAHGLPRMPGDERLLPALATQMREQLLETVAGHPRGLLIAQTQVRRWAEEIEQQRRAIRSLSSPGSRRLVQAQHQLELRNWKIRYQRVLSRHPSLLGALWRPAAAVATIALLSVAYMVAFQRPWLWEQDTVMLLGIALGAYVASLGTYRRHLSQLRTLRRERVALAQEALTAQLQEQVHRGLVRVYDHLLQMMHRMAETLAQAVDELQAWSVAEGPPPLPPVRSYATHLYRPHLNAVLWERCRTYLRRQQDQQGQRGEERLQALWGTPAWQAEMQRLLVDAPAPGRPPAHSIAELVQRTAHKAVAPVGVEYPNPARSQLIHSLAGDYNLEHLLWREASQSRSRRHPLLRSNGHAGDEVSTANTVHRYLEFVRGNARPAANYDVADRMAASGVPVDLAAISGDVDSDLTQTVLQDFRVAGLLTNDPFRITFVRTVHGLALDDLESVRRYRAELHRLSTEQRAQVMLIGDTSGALYGIGSERLPAAERTW